MCPLAAWENVRKFWLKVDLIMATCMAILDVEFEARGYKRNPGRQINIYKRLNTIIDTLPLNKYHTSPDLVP